MMLNDTIVAPATPPGVSALAVIRVSGSDAHSICSKVFRSYKEGWDNASGYTVFYGAFHDTDGKLVDEVIATVFRAPHSFTGEDTIEFSFHGSPFIRSHALSLLVAAGCSLATPGEFTRRAFLNGKMDLSQAEAVADLIASGSTQSHRLAIQQMRGGYAHLIKQMRDQLMEMMALLELELDFSEEDVAFADRKQLRKLLDDITTEIKRLAASFTSGNVLKSGIPVAIIGKPNAGKSTLLNALLKEERAIVSEIAGTTRDTVEEDFVIGGVQFRIIDTAGLRESADTIEQIGVSRSHQKASEAKVIIYVFDPGEMDAAAVADEIKTLLDKSTHSDLYIIPAANKCDLYDVQALQQKYQQLPQVIFISAKTDTHQKALESALSEFAGTLPDASSEVLVTNIRHKAAFDKILESLENTASGMDQQLSSDLLAVHIRTALNYLGEVTGQVSSDEVLGLIFSRFCIGK